ncbi:hypothetical protein [Rubinisphaera margarita]|uniref:hypothetical protein n=1 Tax=Rubinisphaera margarita TaxID=2909586 RepID=UPI001EE8E0CD|nr:hypothetical protein [Rubinisphaera margarita]MCG6154500.1 hypothetical protein [Rubinisphaera margarita]
MTASALLSAEQMCQLIQRRFEYSRLLLEISVEQESLIQQGQYAELIEILLKKQTLLDALRTCSDCDPPLPRQWHSLRNQLPSEERSRCESLLEQTENALASLMDREQVCTDTLQRQKDDTQTQLQLVSGGIAVQNAYQDDDGNSQFDRNF